MSNVVPQGYELWAVFRTDTEKHGYSQLVAWHIGGSPGTAELHPIVASHGQLSRASVIGYAVDLNGAKAILNANK